MIILLLQITYIYDATIQGSEVTIWHMHISVAENNMQLCVVGNQPAIIQSNQSSVVLISCVSWKLLNLLFFPKVFLFFL